MKQINIIGLDGINRVGKGTQANLLMRYFKNKLCETFILKGDGSRTGQGSDPIQDGYSPWWQHMQSRLKNKNELGGYDKEAWDLAGRKLDQELNDFCQIYMPQLLQDTNKKGIILLDRTIFSRYVRNLQYDNKCDIKELGSTIPDLLFLFKADKDILLKRLEDDKDGNEQQYLFRKNIITQHIDLFNNTIDEIPEILKDKTIVIDAAKTKEEIFDEMIASISTRL